MQIREIFSGYVVLVWVAFPEVVNFRRVLLLGQLQPSPAARLEDPRTSLVQEPHCRLAPTTETHATFAVLDVRCFVPVRGSRCLITAACAAAVRAVLRRTSLKGL